MKQTARLLLAAVLATTVLHQTPAAQERQEPARDSVSTIDQRRLARLEVALEGLRQELKIPALSAAIVKDQKVLWARGFGYADIENKIPATEHTPYHLASLTKTFASTILMQLVQEGKVNLDDPVSKYGINLESNGVIRVRHLLSHTSEGNPGQQYRYNGNRFAELDKVIQRATGKTYAELLIDNILDPLRMDETAPNLPPVATTKSPARTEPALENEVREAVMSLINCLRAGDIEQLRKHIVAESTSFPASGGLLDHFTDQDGLRELATTGMKLDLKIQDLEIGVFGNSAVATCLITNVVTRPGRQPESSDPRRTSLLFARQEGSWKLVHSHQSELTAARIAEKQKQRFEEVSKTLAQPYALDSKFSIVRSKYPPRFSTAAGLISTVLDMAKYDIAIDHNRFLTRETQQLAFTPAVSTKGESLPYGLGWFTQSYQGTKFVWHYGYWTCNSSLILKVPERSITFIAMANTDNLSRPTDLGAGDVLSSPVGLAFLKVFIFPEIYSEALPDITWSAGDQELIEQLKLASQKPFAGIYKKELLVQARAHASVGRGQEASRLFRAYGALYSKPMPADLAGRQAIAKIIQVQDNSDKTVEFTLDREQGLRVFAIGEGQGGQMFDYGWIEDAGTGRKVWEMKEPETRGAGGADKNRLVDTTITLAAGKYRLRYKSDDSHSFDDWNSLPPDINFWGIAIFSTGETRKAY